MVAADSGPLIAFSQGDGGRDVELFDQAVHSADPALPPEFVDLVQATPVIDVRFGFWQRVTATRAQILSGRLRARLADTLIAQFCIDHKMPLVTRVGDFRHFARFADLKLAE